MSDNGPDTPPSGLPGSPESHPGTEPTTRLPIQGQTPYQGAYTGGAPASPQNPFQSSQGTAPGTAVAPSRPARRGRIAAAVVATSLIVGGGAGVAGAAAWDAVQDDSASTSSVSSTANVVDQGDVPAAEGSVEAVSTEVLPSVVKIDVSGQEGAGSGSGIILTSDGLILTNNHVVEVAEGGGAMRVSFADGSTASAQILGTDPLTDTAVIKAEGVSGLKAATIGKSANLDVGQGVVAIGSPFGLDATVTSGIVSALDRPVNVGSDADGNATTYPAIQTDAAINPGNSGGPLVDMTGAVVGINSSIRTASAQSEDGSGASGSIGLGFAIPIDEVMPIVDQMSQGETPTHAQLGIRISDSSDESVIGAEVQQVTDGSTAAGAGLQTGDVITQIDDRRVSGADSLVATIRAFRPGDHVTVAYIRSGEEHDADVTLGSDAEATAG